MKTEKIKPKAKVIGQNDNVFNTLGICTSALKEAGQKDEAKEIVHRVWGSENYNDALNIMQEYCEFC